MMLDLPIKIKEIVKNLSYNIDDIGRSSDQVIIFEDKYVLKISNDVKRLKKEYDVNAFLYNKIKSSKNVLFIIEDNTAYYLRTSLNGYSLIHDRYIKNPSLLIEALVKTVHILRSLDKYSECPFLSVESVGNCFTHGDLYISMLPSIHPTPSFPRCIHRSALYVWVEWQVAVRHRALSLVLCHNLKRCDAVGGGRQVQEGGTYVYIWLIHDDVWQKPI